MTVLVVKTPYVKEAVEFFNKLGLEFVQEQHGDGPIHYACERNDVVFEIYPTERESGACKFHNS